MTAAQQPQESSVGQLISEISDDLSTLFRQEIELAKAEVRQEARKAGRAAGMLGAAGFAGYMVALLLTLAVVAGQRLRAVSPVPQQTVETLKEDAQWLKNPTG